MPRLFIALALPDPVLRSLEPLTRGLGDVRWLTPDQQHLTLRFIGEVDRGRVDEIAEALALVDGLPLELRLEGLGHFPPRGEPRVLWVGVAPNPALASLKRRIDRTMAAVGVAPEGRKFTPHVTLARIRSPLSPDRIGTYLMRHSLYRSDSFAVSDFHLFSSWLKPWGAEYQIEASYELVPGLDDQFA
jgi:2'-5' RNA ligase